MRFLALLLFLPALIMASPTESKESYQPPKGDEIHYLQFLPEDYSPSGDKQPLVIFLHGSGERGSDLDAVKRHGPPQYAMKGHGYPFILIAPQCPDDRWWDTGEIIALTKYLIKTLRIDSDRVHITGISMGGYGTWNCLAAEPTLFASGMPICGGGDPSTAPFLKKIPIWAFHGEKDQAVPVEKTKEMEAAVLAAGGRKLRTTYYPDSGHNCWTETYENPAVFAWMMVQMK